jgi:[acyl-carrier-protein] S-malonyltransferase
MLKLSRGVKVVQVKNSWPQHAPAAFAFRGYNLTNLGRTPELLAHPAYGPIVERHLRFAQTIHSDHTHRKTDLLGRVREKRESTLDTFSEDIALIIAVEMAQLELLDQFFGVDYRRARLALGYSLGEITALVAGGTFVVEQVLPPLAAMADDCAELAHGVTMGILFSRGTELPMTKVQQMCVEITSDGNGVLAISSFLSPNTVLLLGQGPTLDRFKARLPELGGRTNLRKVEGSWPPLHTPILWQRNISNRAGVMMQNMPGGLTTPSPTVLSLVTGRPSYNDFNSREMLVRWLDHPQRLWDGVCEILNLGIETVVHVGPDPNLVVATFKRLSDNVTAQTAAATIAGWGKRSVSLLARRAWLTPILSSRAVLLRAPYVAQIILEDWLMEQEVK